MNWLSITLKNGKRIYVPANSIELKDGTIHKFEDVTKDKEGKILVKCSVTKSPKRIGKINDCL